MFIHIETIENKPVQISAHIYGQNKQLVKKTILIKTDCDLLGHQSGITNELLELDGFDKEHAVKEFISLFRDYRPALLIGFDLNDFVWPLLRTWCGMNTGIAYMADVKHMMPEISGYQALKTIEECVYALGITYQDSAVRDAGHKVELIAKAYYRIRELQAKQH